MDLAVAVVINEDGKHVVLDGTLLIQTGDKQLGAGVLT